MKNKSFIVLALAGLAALSSLNVRAQGTAFTYQGRLSVNGSAANGSYDFQFILFNSTQFGFPAGPIVTNSGVAVNNGIFTTTLDFGAGIFTGTNLWLDLSVRSNGGGTFNELLPRQPVTPAPYAVFANTASNLLGTLPASQLPGVVVTNGATGVALTGVFTGNATSAASFTGSLLGDVIGTQGATAVITVGGSTAANLHAAELLANAATSLNTANTIVKRDASGNFTAPFALTASNLLGTLPVSQLPGVVVTNGATGVALTGVFTGNATSADSFTGSLAGDVIGTQGATVVGAVGGSTAASIHAAELLANAATTANTANTIVIRDASGNFTAPLALALPNLRTEASQNTPAFLSANVIGGSSSNTVAAGVSGAVIAGGGSTGGFPQQIGANYSVIGGGYSDTITVSGQQSTIAGGVGNTASSVNVAIGGGTGNVGSGSGATIGGGTSNTSSGNAATVPGGTSNLAAGSTSFAAGNRAKAIHNGAFVWGDSSNADVSSTTNDQMVVRASGGVVLNTAGGGLTLNATDGGAVTFNTTTGGVALNTTAGVTLNASTGVALALNAPTGSSVPVGTLYRDNTVVAWGRVSGNALADSFNVASVVRNSAGNYKVTLNTSFSGVALVPVVSVAYIGAQPTTAANFRMASTGQLLSSTTFDVFINSGTFAAADADFTFIVTGR